MVEKNIRTDRKRKKKVLSFYFCYCMRFVFDRASKSLRREYACLRKMFLNLRNFFTFECKTGKTGTIFMFWMQSDKGFKTLTCFYSISLRSLLIKEFWLRKRICFLKGLAFDQSSPVHQGESMGDGVLWTLWTNRQTKDRRKSSCLILDFQQTRCSRSSLWIAP